MPPLRKTPSRVSAVSSQPVPADESPVQSTVRTPTDAAQQVEVLEKSGLTRNEAKVYLALIDIGPNIVGTLTRRSGIHRRTVYDCLETLSQKGLAGYIIQNNRRLYSATDPQVLEDIVNRARERLLPVVSDLSARYLAVKEREDTLFFKGKTGLKSVFEEQLAYNHIDILGASGKAYDMLKFYFAWYDKRRLQKKITVRILTADPRVRGVPLSTIRYLPSQFTVPVSINIYGEKTAIILWSEHPFAIVIKNRDIAKAQRQYFDMLWHTGKKSPGPSNPL